MKRGSIQCVLIVAFVFFAQSSFAAKVCLRDNFGVYWELKGGRVDKKTYTVKQIVPGICITGGYADVTLTSSFQYKIVIYSGHDLLNTCQPVMYGLVGNDEFFNSSGNYDVGADGTQDGSATFTNISCSTMPPSGPETRSIEKVTDSPAIVKQ